LPESFKNPPHLDSFKRIIREDKIR